MSATTNNISAIFMRRRIDQMNRPHEFHARAIARNHAATALSGER
jgi:hypothetical protein